MTTITQTALDAIHLDELADHIFPFVRMPLNLAQQARAFKREHWHEIVGAGDGYSDPVPVDSALWAALDCAIRLGGEAVLTWIASDNYAAPFWVADPGYVDWSKRFQSCQTPSERRAMLDAGDIPPMGHWAAQTGLLVGYVRRNVRGAIEFCG